MMFLRKRKNTIEAVKSLDAFPKTYKECLQTTTTGGTFSVVSFVLMLWLIIWECSFYLDTHFTFKFSADTNFKEKFKINLDLTVATPCKSITMENLDETGKVVSSLNESFNMDDTWFEMDPFQLAHFQTIQRSNGFLREEYHSIHKVLWKNGYYSIIGNTPKRSNYPDREKDACKIHGSVALDKGAGSVAISTVTNVEIFPGIVLVMGIGTESSQNFSHRIEKLSFGDAAPGIIQPLEGDEKLTSKGKKMYKYFMTVVPTRVNTYQYYGNSFQYSVSELQREVSHDKDSHGTPGIYFKYDMSALTVDIVEEHQSLMQFLTRLFGIVGGIFTCSGLIHRFISLLTNCIFCRFLHSAEHEGASEEARRNPQQQATVSLGIGTPPGVSPGRHEPSLGQFMTSTPSIPVNLMPPEMEVSPELKNDPTANLLS